MAGRPKKAEGEARKNVLRILLTESEREALEEAARSKSLNVSSWARSVLLTLATRIKDKEDE
jgi:hypothetical protein